MAADVADIILLAIGQHPDGIAAPDWVCDFKDPVQEAIAAGSKVILFKTGPLLGHDR